MANVSKIDIDGVQWDIKDTKLTNTVNKIITYLQSADFFDYENPIQITQTTITRIAPNYTDVFIAPKDCIINCTITGANSTTITNRALIAYVNGKQVIYHTGCSSNYPGTWSAFSYFLKKDDILSFSRPSSNYEQSWVNGFYIPFKKLEIS